MTMTLNKSERDRITRLARIAKRQTWRAANIRAGEVTLLSHFDQRYADGATLNAEGKRAREFFDAVYADPSVPPADDVPCDRCGTPLPPDRLNMCKDCAAGDE